MPKKSQEMLKSLQLVCIYYLTFVCCLCLYQIKTSTVLTERLLCIYKYWKCYLCVTFIWNVLEILACGRSKEGIFFCGLGSRTNLQSSS